MKNNLTFAFIGGDLRQLYCISELLTMGYSVRTFGFENSRFSDDVELCDSLSSCIDSADIVVLPLPYNSGNDTINTTFSSSEIYIGDVLKIINGNQILFAGKADTRLKTLCDLYSVHLIDYSQREELSVLNSIPTAEGAIAIAMDETPHTIHGSNCLVLGHGRIGNLLSSSLSALGANVTVVARKQKDLAWIKAKGLNAIDFRALPLVISNYNIIFNTVPTKILDYKLLSLVDNKALIIDLASRPGGVDFETASTLNKRVIWALSLPGKVAPKTAGQIITSTILNILEELGV